MHVEVRRLGSSYLIYVKGEVDGLLRAKEVYINGEKLESDVKLYIDKLEAVEGVVYIW